MRKWWLDRISQDGDGIMDAYPHTEGDPELPDVFWIKVVAVADVLKALRTIKNTLEMSEDDPDECAIDEVQCLILQLEKKSGGEK